MATEPTSLPPPRPAGPTFPTPSSRDRTPDPHRRRRRERRPPAAPPPDLDTPEHDEHGEDGDKGGHVDVRVHGHGQPMPFTLEAAAGH